MDNEGTRNKPMVTLLDAEERFKDHGLQRYFERVKSFIRPCINIKLNPTDDNEIGSAESKIGGCPDLPLDMAWPLAADGSPLTFIAQINLKDTVPFDADRSLPTDGVLSFFYSTIAGTWGYDPEDKDKFLVVYHGSTDDLERADVHDDLDDDMTLRPNRMVFSAGLSFPVVFNDDISAIIPHKYSDAYYDATLAGEHQLLGHADPVQNEMELQCQLVTNGIFCGDLINHDDPDIQRIQVGYKDWVLLLQVGYDDERIGVPWSGGNGRLYFWIRKQDLAALNFDKVWCIFQC